MTCKRILSAVLASSLAAMLFAGCGGSGADSAPSSETSKAPAASPSAAGTPAPADEKTGRLGKIVIYQNCGKVQSSGKPGSNKQDFEDVKKYIEDATNIELEVIIPPTGEEATKLHMMLASQEPIDIFWGNWTKYTDAIQPITDQMKEYGPAITAAWGEEAMSQMTDKDGNIWGVPRQTPTVAYPIYLRTDWLEKVGKKAPTTMDELEEVLRLFKEQDPAGNGQTIPLITTKDGAMPWGKSAVAELSMALSAGVTGRGYTYYKSDEGKVSLSVLDPKYKDFIQKMADWYAKGYIYKEAFATDRATSREMVKKGNVGGTATWYSTVTMQSPYLTENQPDATYTLCAPLKGADGMNCETVGARSDKGALVPKTSKVPDLVVRYLNWCYENVENHITAENGLKDVHWKYVDESKHDIEMISENYIGEFVATQGLAMEMQYTFSDPIKAMHYDYLQTKIVDLDRAVKTDVHDVLFNESEISAAVVNREDINRMVDEELVKFITGVRPINEYDAFIEELHKVGIDKLTDELTRQYNAAK